MNKALVITALLLTGCNPAPLQVVVQPTLEDRTAAGTLYTPSTQSFLRGRHWLEGVDTAEISVGDDHRGSVRLLDSDTSKTMDIVGLDLLALMPHLHYAVPGEPDAFDRFNLMMSEFSRNGLHVPTGSPGDRQAHFETAQDASHPWTLDGPYGFVPDPAYRPLRVSVVNNCLDAQKWELNATDPAGEVFHGWFTFPPRLYETLLSEANELPPDFARDAVTWREEPVPLDLERLRTGLTPAEAVALEVVDSTVGYSSQGSRRKLSKGFVKLDIDGELVLPKRMSDFARYPVKMSDFSGPGRYSVDTRKSFDLAFLYDMNRASIATVDPKTLYRKDARPDEVAYADSTHLEIELIGPERTIILGNLPLGLLVHQAEFAINGFGVGILPASEPAERRDLLLASGPHPSYAYLVDTSGEVPLALNSHLVGVEQVFLRARPDAEEPHFEIVVTSFERIVDLVRYRVPIPPSLIDEARAASDAYTAPSFRSYRDDNIR